MDELCGERACEAAPSCRFECSDVEDAAVAVVVEGDRGRDVLVVDSCREDVERGRVGAREKSIGRPDQL